MKLSVRSKVANGLVICLLVPRVASTAVDVFVPEEEGLDEFAAEDEFVLSPQNGPMATIELRADPASPGDPSGCEEPSRSGVLHINSATPLETSEAECDPSGGFPDPSACGPFGNMDLIEVSMNPPPEIEREFRFEVFTSDPTGMFISDEATVSPEVLTFDGDLACIPQNVWVKGVNDNIVDGDQPYRVAVLDEQDFEVDSIPGVNRDNDNFAGASVDAFGPSSLPLNSIGTYAVQVTNVSEETIRRGKLTVSPSAGLVFTDFAASFVPEDEFDGTSKLKRNGDLVLRRVHLEPGDVLLVQVDAFLFNAGAGNQSINATFEPSNGAQTDDDHTIRPAIP